MPRPKKEDASQPRKRSRTGCWACKAKKVKCGEEKPACLNCQKAGEKCDYSIRLNWEGRSSKRREGEASGSDMLTPGSAATSPAPPSATSSAMGSPAAQTYRAQQSISPGAAAAFSYPLAPTGEQRQMESYFPTTYDYTPQSQYSQQLPVDAPPSRLATTSPAAFQSFYSPTGSRVYSSQESKRKRTDSDIGQVPILYSQPLPETSAGYGQYPEHYYVATTQQQSYPTYYAGQGAYSAASDPSLVQTTAHFRKLSVKSLLSETSQSDSGWSYSTAAAPASVYGYDQGRADSDLPGNDDSNALTQPRPVIGYHGHEEEEGEEQQVGFEYGPDERQFRFEKEEYYARPVPVTIPTSLEPLPHELQDNRMNLLYFHHFLNHTARTLVPHDCPENPFREVLPQMAIRDPDLLNLLLAYAASHRARLLDYPDPSNRTAYLLRDVYTNLRHNLQNQTAEASDKNLTTAIMLASMEIIAPDAAEIRVSWKTHLGIAARMITQRGGYEALHNHPMDKIPYFLCRWFAYLDVMGKLSGVDYGRRALCTASTADPGIDLDNVDDEDVEIDCLLCCTNRCLVILAKVADLAQHCDSLRAGLDARAYRNWSPPQNVLESAHRLRSALLSSPQSTQRSCTDHTSDSSGTLDVDTRETDAVNASFHLSGLLHLQRRVYNLPSSHPAVQRCASGVLASLDLLRRGGPAETCMVLPMFSAGVECLRQPEREKVLRRFHGLERAGLEQVARARRLMQRSWAEGVPWQTLAAGEFIG